MTYIQATTSDAFDVILGLRYVWCLEKQTLKKLEWFHFMTGTMTVHQVTSVYYKFFGSYLETSFLCLAKKQRSEAF